MPTLKQKATAKKVLESNGKKSISQAMKESGYPHATAKNPQQLTNSKGWAELMEEYFPDDLLAKKHKELLTIKRRVRTYKRGELQMDVEELNTEAIGKGLDMAYKLKGKYAAEKIKVEDPYEDLTDEQIDQRLVDLNRRKKAGENK